MIRRSVAGAILGLSLLLGSFAWSGFLALRTVFEPDRSRQVAEELLDNDEVRSQLVNNLSDAIVGAIPADVPVSDEVVESAAARVLNDPEVEALILSAFADTHAAFLGDGDAPQNIDLTAAAETARQSLLEAVPALEGRLPATPVLNVPLPTEHIPNASPVRSFLQRAVPVLAVLGAAGALMALFTTTDRPSIVRRAGIWALTTTAVYLVIGLGVPWLLRRFAPDGAEVLAALLTALLRSTLTPSIALGIAGVGLIGLSFLWPDGGGGRPKSSARAPAEERPRRAAPTQPVQPARRAQPSPSMNRPVQRPGPQRRPTATPYPDQRPPASPYPDQRPASPRPVQSDSNSVFADVPPPSDMPSRPMAPIKPEPAQPASPQVPHAPRWVEGHGWVLDPNDPRPLPASARWVEGVGHVVPGPPPG